MLTPNRLRGDPLAIAVTVTVTGAFRIPFVYGYGQHGDATPVTMPSWKLVVRDVVAVLVVHPIARSQAAREEDSHNPAEI